MKRVLLMTEKYTSDTIVVHLQKIKKSVQGFNVGMLICVIAYWIGIVLICQEYLTTKY